MNLVRLSVSKFEVVAMLNKSMIFGCVVYFLHHPDESPGERYFNRQGFFDSETKCSSYFRRI